MASEYFQLCPSELEEDREFTEQDILNLSFNELLRCRIRPPPFKVSLSETCSHFS